MPPISQLRLLAVLRRPQTERDRSPATVAALRFFGTAIGGVRTAYIRLLAEPAPGRAAVLVPAESYIPAGHLPPRLARRLTLHDPLCLFFPEQSASGGAKRCFSSRELAAGLAVGALGRQIFGLVADGVSSVEALYPGGAQAQAPVADNFFVLDAPAHTEAPPAALIFRAPDGRQLARVRWAAVRVLGSGG